MHNLNRDSFLLSELHGGLWHSTHPERFTGILRSGAILPEPNMPDSDRWKTSRGRDFYPYVRLIGGVSLFDFHQFEPQSYQTAYPLSNWHEFIPYRKDWFGAVWIEINRQQLLSKFISGDDLLGRWKLEKAYRHSLMPGIEAAYLGPLSKSDFTRALFVHSASNEAHELELEGFDSRAYAMLLQEWRAACQAPCADQMSEKRFYLVRRTR
jgi:hypothetical protein